jgi:hypothetical protein
MLIHEQQAGTWVRTIRVTLLGRSIDVDPSVLGAVERSNAYFASDRLCDAERAEVDESIMSLSGSGRAIALAAPSPVDGPALELFEHVVRREPAFMGFDAGAEADRARWLEANRLFRFHFPLWLSELLDEVRGGDSDTILAQWAEESDAIAGTTTLVGRSLVAGLEAADLTALAADAQRVQTAEWLRRLAAAWDDVRAWIEGNGMLPAHPKLVETLEAGGWTWCVATKEFARFEA